MTNDGNGRRADLLRRKRRRPGLGLSLTAAVVVAALVGVAGLLFTLTRPTTWSATASVVVLPARELDPEAVAGYYETLSRGQIVATLAEILRLQRFEAAAAERLGLSEADRGQVGTDVQIVPDTAVITVTATAPERALAERMGDAVLAETAVYLDQLTGPYRLEVVSQAAGTAQQVGAAKAQFVAVTALVALVAGLVTQQVLLEIGTVLARRSLVGAAVESRGDGASDPASPATAEPRAGAEEPALRALFGLHDGHPAGEASLRPQREPGRHQS